MLCRVPRTKRFRSAPNGAVTVRTPALAGGSHISYYGRAITTSISTSMLGSVGRKNCIGIAKQSPECPRYSLIPNTSEISKTGGITKRIMMCQNVKNVPSETPSSSSLSCFPTSQPKKIEVSNPLSSNRTFAVRKSRASKIVFSANAEIKPSG